jgi:DNA-binding FadR family transcriptional regulator
MFLLLRFTFRGDEMTISEGGTLKRVRLVDQVIDRLQDWVTQGKYRPGDLLPPEPALIAALGVSRTTIREAISVLAHAGLLDVRQGDGTYVKASAPREEALYVRLRRAAALELYEVRRLLELGTARLAAEHHTNDDAKLLRSLLSKRDAAQASGDTDELVQADVALHVAIATATKNSVLAELFGTFASALQETISHVVRDSAMTEDTSREHHLLIDAITRRDATAAVDATDRLLAADAGALRRVLSHANQGADVAKTID